MDFRYRLYRRVLRAPLVIIEVLEHGTTDPDPQTFETRPYSRWRKATANDLFPVIKT